MSYYIIFKSVCQEKNKMCRSNNIYLVRFFENLLKKEGVNLVLKKATAVALFNLKSAIERFRFLC